MGVMWWVCTTSTASCGTTAGGDMFQEAIRMLPASFKVPLHRWARGVVCGCMPAWWCGRARFCRCLVLMLTFLLIMLTL